MHLNPENQDEKVESRPSSGKAWDSGSEDETDSSSGSEDENQEKKERDDDEEYFYNQWRKMEAKKGDRIIRHQKGLNDGCWHRVVEKVKATWGTKDMVDTVENEEMVRLTVRELIVYCFFLIVLSTLLFTLAGPTNRRITSAMQKLFLDKGEDASDGLSVISNIDGFWEFMEGQFLDNLYPETWYNQENCSCNNYSCPMGNNITYEGPCPLEEWNKNVLYENRLIGVPRLRQLRVRRDSCDISTYFKGNIKTCYADYQPWLEDTSYFTPRFRIKTDGTAWRHNTADELGTSKIYTEGKFASYSANGAVQDLTRDKNTSYELIKELKETLWLSRSTRAVLVDFSVYNANVNLFCIITLLFEFPATGGVTATAKFDTIQLVRYISSLDYIALGFHIAHVFFILYFLVEEAFELSKLRLKYFKSLWNFYDFMVVVASIATQVLNIYDQYQAFNNIPGMVVKAHTYSDFKGLAESAHMFRDCLGIALFISWLKIFKYINFNKAMGALIFTLSVGFSDIVGFLVMFSIVFCSFAELGFFMFGRDLETYRTFLSSMSILYRTILGDFDYDALVEAQPTWGRLFFTAFIFFNLFILISMLLAIINDTYILVKSMLLQEKEKLEMVDYLMLGYNNILAKAGRRRKSIDIGNAVKLAHVDEERAMENVRESLKRWNFSDIEIEMFFASHGFDQDGFHGFTEQQELELEAQNSGNPVPIRPASSRPASSRPASSRPVSSRPTSSRPVSGRQAKRMAREAIRAEYALLPDQEEFLSLEKRVSKMELAADNINSKLSEMLMELEGIERTNTRRKENMERILDGFMKNPDGDFEI